MAIARHRMSCLEPAAAEAVHRKWTIPLLDARLSGHRESETTTLRTTWWRPLWRHPRWWRHHLRWRRRRQTAPRVEKRGGLVLRGVTSTFYWTSRASTWPTAAIRSVVRPISISDNRLRAGTVDDGTRSRWSSSAKRTSTNCSSQSASMETVLRCYKHPSGHPSL